MAETTKIHGILDLENLECLVEKGEIDTIITVFPDMYGRLVGKRVMGDYFLEKISANEYFFACDYLLACDLEMEPIPGYEITSWDAGYGDFQLIPDLTTLRLCTWLDKTAVVLCDLKEDQSEIPVQGSPRQRLKNQINRLDELGITMKIGSELEFFIFKDSYEEIDQKGFVGLTPFSRYMEDYNILQGTKEEDIVGTIRRNIHNSGIPVEFSKGETGLGQQEINLQYTGALEMADRHVLYKHAAKEIAWQKGHAVSFMAKWNEDHAGSGLHIHVSLWDKNSDKAVFPGSDDLEGLKVSPVFRWFLGGWMKNMKEIFSFYAPYPVSFKRYVEGSFAPTKIAWAKENRTAGFRIVGHGDSLRIECRLGGADANPYLAFASAIAAGMDGIINRIEPDPMVRGNAYESEDSLSVPITSEESIQQMECSNWIREAFGNEVIDHYLHFFRTEQRAFQKVVTDWERARYLERI